MNTAQKPGFGTGGGMGGGRGGFGSGGGATGGFGTGTGGNFGNSTMGRGVGSRNPPFRPVETSSNNEKLRVHSISYADAYKNKSFEEIRLEDYQGAGELSFFSCYSTQLLQIINF